MATSNASALGGGQSGRCLARAMMDSSMVLITKGAMPQAAPTRAERCGDPSILHQ